MSEDEAKALINRAGEYYVLQTWCGGCLVSVCLVEWKEG